MQVGFGTVCGNNVHGSVSQVQVRVSSSRCGNSTIRRNENSAFKEVETRRSNFRHVIF